MIYFNTVMINDRARQSGLVLSVCFFGFMSLLDSSIVNISLPAISRYLNIDMGTAALVNVAYFSALTSALLAFGELSDRFGLKKFFLSGALIFTAGSLFCGFSPNLAALITARFIQGLGGAMMYVTALAIIPKYIPIEVRGGSLSMLMMACTIGIVLGPPLGGFITSYFGWRWIFLINVPIGVAACAVGYVFVPRDEICPGRDRKPFDTIGAWLLFVFICFFCFAFNQGIGMGWTSPAILCSCAAAAGALFMFVIRQKRIKYPLVDVKFFKDMDFTRANAANILAFAVFAGNNFLLPFFLTRGKGFHEDIAGYILMAFPIVFIAVNYYVGKVIDRMSLRLLCVIGLSLQSAAYLVFASTLSGSGIWPVLVFLSLSGAAYAVFSAPINELVLNMAHDDDQGTVSGIFKTGTNFGIIAGVCAFEVVFESAVSTRTALNGVNIFNAVIPGEVLVHGFRAAYMAGFIINTAAVIFALLVREKKEACPIMKIEKIERTPVVVIVDAISTGVYFAPHINKRGYDCVHVLSSRDITGVILGQLKEQDFIENMVYEGDIEKVISALKKHKVVLVIPGSEPGVELADMLSRRLNLPRNDTVLSLARRNKYMMQENIRARGLRAINEKCSAELGEIVTWAKKGNIWPMVLKPVASAGTEGVHFCNNADEVEKAYNAIMSHGNVLGNSNTAVLAQERITGREGCVNTVSHNGKHYISDCWTYRKIVIDGIPIYDYLRLRPHPSENERELVKYDANVLDALGFVNGPAHAEIMETDNGPVLVEVGARVMGASLPPEIMTDCIGHNQLDLSIDCFLDPKSFLKHVERPYKIARHCMMKFLIAYEGGCIRGIPGRDIIEKLRSVKVVRIPHKPGDDLIKTVDLLTSPGEVILVNEDPAALEDDYNRISELEKQGLFDIVKR